MAAFVVVSLRSGFVIFELRLSAGRYSLLHAPQDKKAVASAAHGDGEAPPEHHIPPQPATPPQDVMKQSHSLESNNAQLNTVVAQIVSSASLRTKAEARILDGHALLGESLRNLGE